MQRMQETERRSALTFQFDKHSKGTNGTNGKRKQSLRNRESDIYDLSAHQLLFNDYDHIQTIFST